MQLTFPYENLSIYHPPPWFNSTHTHPIRIDVPGIYEKIVLGKRGGFCLELNAIYHWALQELGYTVVLRSAKVILGIPTDNLTENPTANKPDFHIILLVTLPNTPSTPSPSSVTDPINPLTESPDDRFTRLSQHTGRWLCDAGSTRVSLEPIPLLDGAQSYAAGGIRTSLRYPSQWLDKRGYKYNIQLPGRDMEHFCFFEDVEMTTTAEKILGWGRATVLAAMPGEMGEGVMVMGSVGGGYRFSVRDREGVVVEERVIEGGGEEREGREKAWRECRELLRERFGIEMD
ncbi:hypothetical protein BC829DRAFT_460306 [Chytridium lagenaria]|nr:hypothetical protein BC829DRAFT_460306 [Chytridium lagenaria]